MEGHADVAFQGGFLALMKGLGTRGGQSRLLSSRILPYECKAHVSSRWGSDVAQRQKRDSNQRITNRVDHKQSG